MLTKEMKKQIYLKALSKAAKHCIGNRKPSRIAIEYGISTSTLSTLVNAKKDFNVTTIAQVAEAIGVKTSYLYELTEVYLPTGFSLLDI